MLCRIDYMKILMLKDNTILWVPTVGGMSKEKYNFGGISKEKYDTNLS